MKLLKEIVVKGDKRYTNYVLQVRINNKNYKVPIMPKTFGRDWTHPSVRQNFTLLDLMSELVVKDNNESKEKEKNE